MADDELAHVDIAFDVDASPIAGRVRREGGRAVPFQGWTEFARVLEAVLAELRAARRPI
jgi:hypothetical protein